MIVITACVSQLKYGFTVESIQIANTLISEVNNNELLVIDSRLDHVPHFWFL